MHLFSLCDERNATTAAVAAMINVANAAAIINMSSVFRAPGSVNAMCVSFYVIAILAAMAAAQKRRNSSFSFFVKRGFILSRLLLRHYMLDDR